MNKNKEALRNEFSIRSFSDQLLEAESMMTPIIPPSELASFLSLKRTIIWITAGILLSVAISQEVSNMIFVWGGMYFSTKNLLKHIGQKIQSIMDSVEREERKQIEKHIIPMVKSHLETLLATNLSNEEIKKRVGEILFLMMSTGKPGYKEVCLEKLPALDAWNKYVEKDKPTHL